MKSWHVALILCLLLAAAGAFVYLVGVQPKAINKITLSQFNDADVVVDSLFLSIAPELEHSAILFLGLDLDEAKSPISHQILEKIWIKFQKSKNPFAAVVAQEGLHLFPEMNAEQFDFSKEPERLLQGLQSAEKQNIHLLVIVDPIEASPKVPSSMISVARRMIYKQNPDQITGLAFSNFPRQRAEEEFFPIPCNTGEADLGNTAGLGCYIIQKARLSYKKHFASGKYVGLLDQLGIAEYVFLLTQEK